MTLQASDRRRGGDPVVRCDSRLIRPWGTAVKFGVLRSPDGALVSVDARPAAVKTFLAYSLTRLGVDHVARESFLISVRPR
jgi:hypothetical protein